MNGLQLDPEDRVVFKTSGGEKILFASIKIENTLVEQIAYKEVLKKKMYEHSSRASGASTDAVALRGVGKCPHGTAIKCKNFPNCPGAKCIYSHGQCRYDITCNKATCPFDHSNKPRVCMACVNEIKGRRKN